MKKLSMLFVVFAAFFMFVACDNNLKFTPAVENIDTGDTSDTTDTTDTADTSDTSDTTDTSDTADTADTSDTSDTTDTADTSDTSDTADTADTSDTSDTADTADTSYNSPYGSLSLNFSVDQIRNNSDGQQSMAGIIQDAFATGTYGNGSASVTPADAYMIQSMATYYQQSSGGQTHSGVQVQQIPIYAEGQQGVGGNPVIILDISEENVAIGTLNISLYPGSQATLYVADVNWNTNQISCFHAFGEGDVNITNLGDIAQHGALAFNGNVTLYSPKNYDGNGDISGQIGIPACDPVQ